MECGVVQVAGWWGEGMVVTWLILIRYKAGLDSKDRAVLAFGF